MSYRAMLAAGVAVLGWSLAAACQAASGASETDACWTKAVKAGDVEAVTKCYAPDAIVWFSGSPMAKGTKAIHDFYQAFLSTTTVQDATISELGSQTKGNDSVAWGTYTFTSAPKTGGKPTTATGRYTEVAKKINGKWLYLVDHASDDPPPAPAAK